MAWDETNTPAIDRKDSRAVFTLPMASTQSHARTVLESHGRLQDLLGHKQVVIDGESLDVAAVVAVARSVDGFYFTWCITC